MAVRIRMRKSGRKNGPSFRVVATDARFPRDGRSLELLGWYDPKVKGVNFNLKTDRIEYWRSRGAQMSMAVRNLLRRAKKAVG